MDMIYSQIHGCNSDPIAMSFYGWQFTMWELLYDHGTTSLHNVCDWIHYVSYHWSCLIGLSIESPLLWSVSVAIAYQVSLQVPSCHFPLTKCVMSKWFCPIHNQYSSILNTEHRYQRKIFYNRTSCISKLTYYHHHHHNLLDHNNVECCLTIKTVISQNQCTYHITKQAPFPIT